MRAVFLEYAWDMGGATRAPPTRCPPTSCASSACSGCRSPAERAIRAGGAGRPVDTFVTRLHVRYDAASFPEDLVFQETATAPTSRAATCCGTRGRATPRARRPSAIASSLRARAEQEAGDARPSLTGWPIDDIRRRMGPAAGGPVKTDSRRWWQRLFTD